MQRIMMKSKLHQARVTHSDMHYEGSIEIDVALMEAAEIIPYEQVHLYDINNGNRLITYAIPGKRGKRHISVNGAAARKVHVDDRIIIVAYGAINKDEEKGYKPRIVLLDMDNNVIKKK